MIKGNGEGKGKIWQRSFPFKICRKNTGYQPGHEIEDLDNENFGEQIIEGTGHHRQHSSTLSSGQYRDPELGDPVHVRTDSSSSIGSFSVGTDSSRKSGSPKFESQSHLFEDDVWKESNSSLFADDQAFKQQSFVMTEYQVYPQLQYPILVTVTLMILCNSMSFLTFNIINKADVEYFYQVEGRAAGQYLSFIFVLAYPFGSMLAYLANRLWGLKECLQISGVLTLLGLVLRFSSLYVSEDSGSGYLRYNCILCGQILLGLAQPMALNLIPKIANYWFDVMKRDSAVKLLYAANPVGTLLGLFLSLEVKRQTLKPSQGFTLIYTIQLVLTALALFALATINLEYPPTPPSRSNETILKSLQIISDKVSDGSSKENKKWALWKKHFVFLSLSFSISFGFGVAIWMSMSETKMVENAGYTENRMMVFVLVYLCGGLFGLFISWAITHLHSYHTLRKAGFIVMVLSMLFADWPLQSKSTAHLPELTLFIFGSISISLTPISIDTASEVTFGIPEEISSGVLLSFGHIGALMLYSLFGAVETSTVMSRTQHSKMLNLFITMLGCSFSILAYGTYKRLLEEAPISEHTQLLIRHNTGPQSSIDLPDIEEA